jgi:hypothetical protein
VYVWTFEKRDDTVIQTFDIFNTYYEI